MSRRLVLAVGVATGCAVGAGVLAGAGERPSGRLAASVRRSPWLLGVQQWAQSASTGTVAAKAGSALRQAATRVGARAPGDVAAATPATSGGVIPLETVPLDELSEWELDLLTTPDS